MTNGEWCRYLLSQMISKSSTVPVGAMLRHRPCRHSLLCFRRARRPGAPPIRTPYWRYIIRYDISLRDAICLLHKRDMIFVLLIPKAYIAHRMCISRHRHIARSEGTNIAGGNSRLSAPPAGTSNLEEAAGIEPAGHGCAHRAECPHSALPYRSLFPCTVCFRAAPASATVVTHKKRGKGSASHTCSRGGGRPRTCICTA